MKSSAIIKCCYSFVIYNMFDIYVSYSYQNSKLPDGAQWFRIICF